jgi:hypothetical protein
MPESDILRRVQELVAHGEFLISSHGYDELAADGIFAADMVDGLSDAVAVEEYPRASKGPTVLVLQWDQVGRPIHIVWGIPKGFDAPAVLVTAYRPDPDRWSADFMRRRKG